MRGRALAGPTLLAIGLLVAGTGCDFFAVRFAPKKTAKTSSSPLALRAQAAFREALAQGRYDRLPESLRLLTAAYIENPRDPSVAFLLGMAHLWKISERAREARVEPTITDELILADRYLAEARRLNPGDARIPGFEGSVKMALGAIHQDEGVKRLGYFTLKNGIRRYPEFNLFTMSFVLSNAPRENARFAEAVDDAWKNLEICARRKIGRTAVDVSRLASELRLSANAAIAGGSEDRACRNPPTAPHNMEGFLLHMGDLVVKKGDVETAREIYRLARVSPNFATWPYASLLERRIGEAPERARQFASGKKPAPEMMFQSAYACTGCHATVRAPGVAAQMR